MKRILYFTAIFLMLLPVLSEKGVVFAQNMSTEYYDLNYLWHQADETGYFSIERCTFCGEFIASYEECETYDNMENHILSKHAGETNDDFNYGNAEEETGGGSSNNNSSSNNMNYIYVVDLGEVAYALERLGICDADMFVDDYDAYCGKYVRDRAVFPTDLDAFIKPYELGRNVSLKTAMDNKYQFLMFSKPSQSGGSFYVNGRNFNYYDVVSNNDLGQYNNCYYHYLYVFEPVYISTIQPW